MKALFTFLFLSLISLTLYAQNTVGVLNNGLKAYDAYTLYTPADYTSTYMINNCGQVINQWNSDYIPGLAAYLLPEGRLLRTGRDVSSNEFTTAGKGGIIQIFDWDGTLEWEANVNDVNFGAHHDIEYMPNGNILILRWERKFQDELIQAGKDPAATPNELWIPSIIEIRPLDMGNFDIVWEWHLFDHLVQDQDATKDNFGVISENPRKVDINYNDITEQDWGHLNCVDFNVGRDEILLSSRNFDEIWIIDHSTTSVEAASDNGGNTGLGGQLLYRYGNLSTYQDVMGLSTLDGQHDAEFLISGDNEAPVIQLYNNNNSTIRPSAFVEFSPKMNGNNYALEGGVFDITGEPIVFESNAQRNFDSAIMSSVQTLANGNLLINAGRSSNFVEFDSLGNEVWRYKGPVSLFGPNEQGSNIIGATFRIEKFSINDPMFDNLDVSVKAESIEINPNLTNCGITSTKDIISLEASVFPNPFDQFIQIETEEFGSLSAELYSSLGTLIFQKELSIGERLNTELLQAGIYFLKLKQEDSEKSFKMIKF